MHLRSRQPPRPPSTPSPIAWGADALQFGPLGSRMPAELAFRSRPRRRCSEGRRQSAVPGAVPRSGARPRPAVRSTARRPTARPRSALATKPQGSRHLVRRAPFFIYATFKAYTHWGQDVSEPRRGHGQELRSQGGDRGPRAQPASLRPLSTFSSATSYKSRRSQVSSEHSQRLPMRQAQSAPAS